MRLLCPVWLALLLLAPVTASAATIAEVKSVGNWMQVTVEGIATCVDPVECYIQSPDRSGGIRVIGNTDGISSGDAVTATGTFAVVDGEPSVTGATLVKQGIPSPIRPLGMSNRAIGGTSKWSPLFVRDYTQGSWTPAIGANNTGLLITTWGTVTGAYYSPISDTHWFCIDDGAGLVGDFGDMGVLVYTHQPVRRGDFVSVTGVSSTEVSIDDPSRLTRVVRTRSADDVRVVKPYQPPEYPFSDEFDGTKLDPRWGTYAWSWDVSLTTEPGWLTLTQAPDYTGYRYDSCFLDQQTDGDWDLEVRMRVAFGAATYDVLCQEAGVGFTTSAMTYLPTALIAASDHYRSGVYLRDEKLEELQGDTYYFRVRRRGSTLYLCHSTDGTNYPPEIARSFTDIRPYVRLWTCVRTRSGVPVTDFQAHFDYIRIVSVPGEGGAQ